MTKQHVFWNGHISTRFIIVSEKELYEMASRVENYHAKAQDSISREASPQAK